jgi:hypothetical protein
MPVTIGEICDGIATTFDADADLALVRVESYNEITEGINAGDCPLLQVYPEDGTIDETGRTDRTTFGGGVRQKMIRINCDFYTRQRSHIGEGIGETVDLIDNIIDALEGQNLKPYFGVTGIQAWSVTWNRVMFEYAGARYPGTRFVLTIWVF